MYSLARPFLFGLDAERAHGLGLKSLDLAHATGTLGLLAKPRPPLPTKLLGLTFPNPVGLAAGLDKNGAHIDALLGLGFGFVEVGTVTPRPQPGNPKPRMFRLVGEQALINRLGFNTEGVDALVRNVERAQRKGGLLGINIGKNKDPPNADAASDYLHCLERVYPLADYITVNISSPNTAGLRELQEEQALRQLVGTLREAQEKLGAQHGKRVPMLVKIAPDLSDDDVDACARVLGDLGVDGVIAHLKGNHAASRWLRPDFENDGFRSIGPLAARRYDWRVLGRIPRLLRAEQPDILHTHLPRADFLGAVGHYFSSCIP